MPNMFQSLQLPVNQNVGTATLVAAVAGTRIRVVSAFLVATAASTLNFQSHVTTGNKTGPISLAANDGIVLPYSSDGWFLSSIGEALDLVVGGTGPVTGSINYVAG